MNVLVVGNGARESSLAWRLAQDAAVSAVMTHENPTIAGVCRRTGGSFAVADFTSPDVVAKFARSQSVDLAIVQNDNALASGVVDQLKAAGVRSVGPTRAGAEIEWNKAFARDFLRRTAPSFCPWYATVTNPPR